MSEPDHEKSDVLVGRLKEEGPDFHDGDDGGPYWEFEPWDYDDDAIGVVEGEKPVCVVLSFPQLRGFCLSVEDARKLAHALVQAAECAESGEFPGGVGGEA